MLLKYLVPILYFLCFFIDVKAAPVDTVRVFSQSMQRSIPSVVIVPGKKSRKEIFPVLYLLHGFGGNFSLWINKVPELQQLADEYRCVIVCPDGGKATLYFNNPLDSSYKFETYFTKELMPYIQAHYPVSKDRKFNAISGLSMGGFGSFYIASRNSALFDAAGSMSGVLDLQPFAKYSAIGKANLDTSCCKVNWEAFTRTPTVHLAVECGLQDYLLGVNRNMHRKMEEMNIAHDYTERPGKHEWVYWQNAITYQLLFFRKVWDKNAAAIADSQSRPAP